MDRSLKGAGLAEMVGEITVYFPAVDISIGMRVDRLLSSTLTKLQAVALALECILFLCSVVLYSNSQSVINVCVSKVLLAVSNFCNHCWIK
ncbi:hypothetical protein G9A89_010793 [Geosiphon pyriformis]|nr:hypothetical protein G9A89_010793 [Geosiphon pyriformis]